MCVSDMLTHIIKKIYNIIHIPWRQFVGAYGFFRSGSVWRRRRPRCRRRRESRAWAYRSSFLGPSSPAPWRNPERNPLHFLRPWRNPLHSLKLCSCRSACLSPSSLAPFALCRPWPCGPWLQHAPATAPPPPSTPWPAAPPAPPQKKNSKVNALVYLLNKVTIYRTFQIFSLQTLQRAAGGVLHRLKGQCTSMFTV